MQLLDNPIADYLGQRGTELADWIAFHFWPVILLFIIIGMIMLARRHVRLHGWKI